MKQFKTVLMLAAIAAASFTFTSCDDDDPWRGPDRWTDWGWGDNGGGPGDDNQPQEDSRITEANLLAGDWSGEAQLSERDEDGNFNTYNFDINMVFVQDRTNAITGSGTEIDQVKKDGSVDQQTLKFTWSIADNNNIYITYTDSGSTYLLDANASEDGYGFHLGYEKGYENDTFYGYMLGTGSVKGDLMMINMERTSGTSRTRSVASSATTPSAKAFGTATARKPIAGGIEKLPTRR